MPSLKMKVKFNAEKKIEKRPKRVYARAFKEENEEFSASIFSDLDGSDVRRIEERVLPLADPCPVYTRARRRAFCRWRLNESMSGSDTLTARNVGGQS